MRVLSFVRKAIPVLVLGLLVPIAASSTPATYTFTGGSVDVTGTVGASTLFTETGIPLTGDFVIFDDAVPSVDDLSFTGGPSGLITLSSAYGGFDGFTLDAFTVLPGTGFGTIAASGGPTTFAVTVGPVDVTATATPFVGAVAGPTIPFAGTTAAISGTIDIGAGTLALTGVTLLVVGGIPGEPVPLIVKGDFLFTGMVPEPGLALMLAVAAVAVARKTRIPS